jgi:RHS repeat-associated protein
MTPSALVAKSSRILRPLATLALACGFAATAHAQVTAKITSPVNGAVLGAGSNTINATASSPDGIFFVEFFVDNGSRNIDLTAPYSKPVTLSAGTHVLKVVATDACCEVTGTSALVTVTVTERPEVVISAPLDGASQMATTAFALAAEAYDNDGTVASVSFYADGVLISTDSAAPFTASYTGGSVGTHKLTAVAKDNLNITGAPSTEITVTVTPYNAGAPALAITAPAPGAVITGPANVAFTATASDTGGSVAKVDFYAGTTLIASDTTSPYAANFAAVAQGTHTLKAIATDNLGATTQKTVSVTVNAPAAVSAIRSYVYDTAQRLCKVIEPESGATVMDYDAAGNLVWSATGQALPSTASCDRNLVPVAARTNRTYDVLNRLKVVDVPASTNDPTYEYYDDGGLKKLTNGGAVWDYTYNRRSMPVTETLTVDGLVRTLTHAYSAEGIESTLTYPDGMAVPFTPNARGQATRAGVYATNVTYHPNGGMAGFTTNACSGTDCVVHSMTPNVRGLPLRSLDKRAGATAIIDDTYVYDENGNVASITDGSGNGRTRNGMVYDGLDRLRATNAPNLSWLSATTTYDALDNIRSNKVGSRTWTYNYDATTNRLVSLLKPTSTAIGYDANGNITSPGTAAYTFDAANRMLAATGKESYAYDGHGRRVKMVRNSDLKASYPFYSLDGKLITENDHRLGTASTIDYVYLNGSLIGKRTNAIGSTTYAHRNYYTDALGSPVAESTTAAVVMRLESYTPYGEQTDLLNGTPLEQGPAFTGHVTDAATGLSYMQQRYYDPVLGRFLSDDPVPTDFKTGRHFNRYWYANGNPYSFVDPDGRCGTRVENAAASNCSSAGVWSTWIKNTASEGRRILVDAATLVRDIPKNYADSFGHMSDAIDASRAGDTRRQYDSVQKSNDAHEKALEGVALVLGAAEIGIEMAAARGTAAVAFKPNTSHIFRNAPGHLLRDTAQNRALIASAVNPNYLVAAKGPGGSVLTYRMPLGDGRQVWADVHNGLITNGGVNQVPRP